MFESRTSHVAQFLVSSSGELLKNGDTFDDCPAVFSTAEFIAIAPDSLSCWSDQKKYPSDSMIELAESSRVFAKEFLDHRREESRSRPELDEKDHLMKGRAFNLFRKQVSYLGEKPLTLAGTIGAHVYG